MRKVTVKDLQGDINITLSREVEIIYSVMQMGKAVDAITYEATLNGVQLKEFLQSQKLTVPFCIVDTHQYLLTAYDW